MADGACPVWVSPLPPLPSGIGQYSADLLDATTGVWELSVLPESGSNRSIAGHRVATFNEARKHDRLILQIGNSHFHEHAFALAERGGSILVMHDVVLHHARLAEFVRRGQASQYIELMQNLYGETGAGHAREVLRGTGVDGENFPLCEDLIRRARSIVVHSEHARLRVERLVPGCSVSVVPMGVPLPALVDRHSARRHFGIRDDAFLVTSITHVNPMKRMPVVLRAFRRLLEKVRHARLVIAGTVAEGVQLERQIELLGLKSHVRLTGYVSDDDARILARAGDVSVNLRYPSTGETSASLLRLMAAAAPVIATKHGSALELPEGAVLHLPVDRLEEETLAEYLIWLAGDPTLRARIGAAGREFIETSHSMGVAVDGYRAVLNNAWGLCLPPLPQALIEEPAPHLSTRSPSEPLARADSRLMEEIVISLAALGLTEHDGTIENIARAMCDVGLDTEGELSELPENANRTIDPELLEILACPVCKVRVRLEDERLICDTCGREYRIENGIPIMLVEDDATT